MLTISSTVLETANFHDGRGTTVEDYSTNGDHSNNFPDPFAGGGLLEDIDFDDLFVGFDEGNDGLPNLEIDPNELLTEFSSDSREEYSGTTSSGEVKNEDEDRSEEIHGRQEDEDEEEEEDGKSSDQTVPETDEGRRTTENNSSAVVKGGDVNKDRHKTLVASPIRNSHGKRKVKVDWTPELHRRFVQAVEQLGVDKAVPSRILEIMGIDCLTRHNIASHLQKYRSHRKHLMEREAEAASWSQRRHMYGGSATGGHKREMTSPWLAPTIGFPPPPPPIQPFRPLHVWGHPTVDHAMMHMWPKHLAPSRPSPPLHQWAQHPPPPPDSATFWHHHPHYQTGPREGWIQNGAPTQGTPCYQPMPPQMQRFPTQPVPGIPPPLLPSPPPLASPQQQQRLTMYRPDVRSSSSSNLKLDLHPSKESIDAAIGDVLSKPWLPLPLGLKPPSVDGVLVELQRQGIAKIPPSCTV